MTVPAGLCDDHGIMEFFRPDSPSAQAAQDPILAPVKRTKRTLILNVERSGGGAGWFWFHEALKA
jgi:hypothetical protein